MNVFFPHIVDHLVVNLPEMEWLDIQVELAEALVASIGAERFVGPQQKKAL